MSCFPSAKIWKYNSNIGWDDQLVKPCSAENTHWNQKHYIEQHK